jgi:DNA-binding NarL/FixJ family response regulator
VLAQLATGACNKEARHTLGISPRAIEAHGTRIMTKIGARNAADKAAAQRHAMTKDLRGGIPV